MAPNEPSVELEVSAGTIRVVRSSLEHNPTERMVKVSGPGFEFELFPRQAIAFAGALRLIAGVEADIADFAGADTVLSPGDPPEPTGDQEGTTGS